jgi:hypothetical protein
MRVRAAGVTRTACGAALLATMLSACALPGARAARTAPLTPWGLPRAEQSLRDALAANVWDDALARAADPARGAPGDPLLRALYEGSAAYYAGRHAASAAAFERAAVLTEERETWRLSRGVAALAAGDRVLPYVPGENERLLAHQYAMLARLRGGDAQGAAVEARRVDALLQRFSPTDDPRERALRAVLRYLSGVAFELAGERTDAAVAYRNARALGLADSASASADAPVADRAAPSRGRRPRRAPAPTGEVVVLVERGFVAHRVDTRLRVRAARGASDDAGGFAAVAEGLGALLATRLAPDQGVWSDAASDVIRLDDAGPEVRGGAARRSHAELLTLAWPAFRRPTPLATLAGVFVERAPAAALAQTVALVAGRAASAEPTPAPTPPLLTADLSEALAADLRRDRAGMLARLVARAALRQALVGEARRRAEPLGDLLAALGRSAERADTRSWHLLPARLELVRLRLPAGTRPLALDLGGATVPLGEVEVPANGLVLHAVRLWHDARPAPSPAAGI